MFRLLFEQKPDLAKEVFTKHAAFYVSDFCSEVLSGLGQGIQGCEVREPCFTPDLSEPVSVPLLFARAPATQTDDQHPIARKMIAKDLGVEV